TFGIDIDCNNLVVLCQQNGVRHPHITCAGNGYFQFSLRHTNNPLLPTSTSLVFCWEIEEWKLLGAAILPQPHAFLLSIYIRSQEQPSVQERTCLFAKGKGGSAKRGGIEAHGKRTALLRLRFDRQHSAMPQQNMLDDGKAQTG